MSPVQMWLALGMMLAAGGWLGVGIFLPQFAAASILTAVGARAGIELAGQLDLFLASALAIIVFQRFFARVANRKLTRSGEDSI